MLLLGLPALAQEQVPSALQVAILLKVLVYDRTLAIRSKDGLRMAVVYDPKNEASKTSKDGFVKAFNDSAHQVAGTTIELVEVTQDQFEAEAKKNLDIAIIGNGVSVSKAVETARRYNLVTFAPDDAAVQSGVVIGLVPRDGKPRLLINVNASLAAGMQLDPQILRLAELVRGEATASAPK